MKINIKYIVLTSILTCCFFYAQAQKSTEVHIPIGKSPGLSGKYTEIGKVESIDLQDSTLTITEQSGSTTMNFDGNCIIMLDYSNLKQSSQIGELADVHQGALIEVKYFNNDPDDFIEWIKIEMDKKK